MSNAVIRRQSGSSGRVPDVVFAGKRKLEFGPFSSITADRPGGLTRAELQVLNSPVCVACPTVALHRTKRLRNATIGAIASIESYDSATARDQVHQPFERSLNCLEVPVNIGVIELHRSQNDAVGKIMQEFRAFIEEGGVVFVAFENEVLAVAELKAT